MALMGPPIAVMLNEIGKPQDYEITWDLYRNSLTDPDFEYDPKPQFGGLPDEPEEDPEGDY